jgi:serine/threonine protein phosphatase 1
MTNSVQRSRYFAIGDIHGHFDELEALMHKIEEEAHYDEHVDHLIFLGDLVDNGPRSKDVVTFCRHFKESNPERFHPIKGNHDDMFVDAMLYDSEKYKDWYIWWNQGGRETLKSYTDPLEGEDWEKAIMQPKDYVPKEHLEFLDTLPLFYETPQYFFVHGGIDPNKPLGGQEEEDLLWIRERFYLSKRKFPKTIVFAHTPFESGAAGNNRFEPFVREDRIGINTMPRNIGHLTCVELQEGEEPKFYTQEKL